MKKLLLLFSVSVMILSCSKQECQFSKMETKTLNFNKIPTEVTETKINDGCFYITKTDDEATFNANKSSFKLILNQNKKSMQVVDFDGTSRNFDETSGYKIGNETRGDTIVVKYYPVNPESNTLKFGLEYKFYN